MAAAWARRRADHRAGRDRPPPRPRRRGRHPPDLRGGLPPPRGRASVDTAEVVGRYPRWGDELRALFDCDRLLRPPARGRRLPEVGEALGPFLLLAELGRGASGRTFLATDPRLADRPVVVKVIPDDQDEHLALARLRHTHIVPLFSEHTFPERGLRGLCMPYLGGASLGRDPRRPGRRPARAAIGQAPGRGHRPEHARRRPPRPRPTGRSAAAWSRRPTSRRSPGSPPAWPTRSTTPTPAGSSTWTSSRRTS